MRTSKNGQGASNSSNAVQKEPSIQEIQERIEYNRRLESESPSPKSRFGARSQMQHEEISEEDSNNSRERSTGVSTGVESESVWQSLSSASYESEEESWQHQQNSGRKGSSSNRRRRSSPREMMM